MVRYEERRAGAAVFDPYRLRLGRVRINPNVGFAPESGHAACILECPLSAMKRFSTNASLSRQLGEQRLCLL
jgi:hypothetical protein